MSGSSNVSVVTNNVMETDGAKVVSVVSGPVTAQKSEPPNAVINGLQQPSAALQTFSVKSEPPVQFSVKSEPGNT